jgi:hypothetical protein
VQFVATAGVFVDGKDTLSVVDSKAVTDKIARLHSVKSASAGTLSKVFSQME